MKKFLVWLLLAALALTLPFTAMADEEHFELEPVLLPAMDMTAAEWYAENSSRTMMVACATLDAVLSDNETISDIMVSALEVDRVYISFDGEKLAVFFYGSDNTLELDYNPATNDMDAFVINQAFDVQMQAVLMEGMKENGLLTSYYQMSSDEVVEMLGAIVALMGEE